MAAQDPDLAASYQAVTPSADSVPTLYCNGFINNLGAADVSTMLMVDGAPVAKVHMSFTTAKTLVALLGDMINNLEAVTKHDIMMTMEVDRGLKELIAQRKQK